MADEEQNTIMDLVREKLKNREKANMEKEFKDWCDLFEAVPSDYEYILKDGLRADIELQPLWWLSSGCELLQSSKGTASVRHRESNFDRSLNSYLVYPIFQMGTEVFLKGMWLCQFDECRLVDDSVHIEKGKRDKYTEQLKKALGHDLLKIIDAVRGVPKYAGDKDVMRFLKIIEGMIRKYYFPLYEAQKRSADWATARYPKRFYNDQTQQAKPDSFSSYPTQWVITRLFEEMEKYVIHLWGLHSGLIRQSEAKQAEATI